MSEEHLLTRRNVLKLAGLTAVAGGAGLVYGYDSHDLRVESQTIRLPKWKADGLKVGLISDFHCNRPHQAARAVAAINLLRAQKPDVIVVPGDFLNYDDDVAIDGLRTALAALESTGIPVFATLGNHDYCVRYPNKIIHEFAKSSVRLLRNETVDFHGVTILGIDDAIMHQDKHDTLGNSDAESILALFHEPDAVDRVDRRVGLVVSGHSHGGEICLPGRIPLYAPKFGRKYIGGYYAGAPVPLYVTRGVGALHVRIFCPPEVSVLTLKGGGEAR